MLARADCEVVPPSRKQNRRSSAALRSARDDKSKFDETPGFAGMDKAGHHEQGGTRRKSRELALQMLFQLDMGQSGPGAGARTFWSERQDLGRKVREFSDQLFGVACERQEEIDQLIERNAEHWRMDRMAAVDRNLLRAGVAEFLGFPHTPRPVVINEALEIARRFSTPESVQFINGVLDSVARELGDGKKK